MISFLQDVLRSKLLEWSRNKEECLILHGTIKWKGMMKTGIKITSSASKETPIV